MTGVIAALAGSVGGLTFSGATNLTIGSGGYDFNDGTYRYVDTTYGYNGNSIGYGSVTNNVFGSGVIYSQLRWDNFAYYTYPGNVLVGTQVVVLLVVNAVLPNSGWSSITINGTTYTRASANYSTDSTTTTWSWPAPSNTFGTSGTIAVSWG